jgi:hypothetical protein
VTRKASAAVVRSRSSGALLGQDLIVMLRRKLEIRRRPRSSHAVDPRDRLCSALGDPVEGSVAMALRHPATKARPRCDPYSE